MMLKKLTVLFLFGSAATINCQSQTTADVDTFTVNSAQFIATTPTDWFSGKILDGIQEDTTWNYKMVYAPKNNPSNIYAEVWIHIVNNSKYIPTKKEQKQFKRECKVSQKQLGNWPSYFLNYKGKKMKDCKSCAMIYTQVYSVPLNNDQTMDILFVGQGTWAKIYPLTITWTQFSDRFVKTNDIALSEFRIINFHKPMRKEPLKVDGYYLNYLVPFGFASTSPSFGNASIVSPTLNFRLNIIGTTSPSMPSGQKGQINDTSVSVVSFYDIIARSQKIKVVTKREIPLGNSRVAEVTFSAVGPSSDAVLITYYENLLREYATRFVAENVASTASVIPASSTPDLKPTKKIDRSIPLDIKPLPKPK